MKHHLVTVHAYYTFSVQAGDRDDAAEAALAEVEFAPGDQTHQAELLRQQTWVPMVLVEGEDGKLRVAP